jgi:transcriptional regulator with XRE-family HTH domain
MATRLEIKQALEQDRAQLPGNWRDVLDREISADARGKLGVSKRMGVSRAYVSRVANGSIPEAEVSPRFISRLLESLNAVECPHTHEPTTPSVCREHASRTYASLSFADVDHWSACQRCIHNPINRAKQ